MTQELTFQENVEAGVKMELAHAQAAVQYLQLREAALAKGVRLDVSGKKAYTLMETIQAALQVTHRLYDEVRDDDLADGLSTCSDALTNVRDALRYEIERVSGQKPTPHGWTALEKAELLDVNDVDLFGFWQPAGF